MHVLDRPSADHRLTPALQTAPLLVPNIIKPRPFKAFESSTVVITTPKSHTALPCLFKPLASKLGIEKEKKSEPAAFAKPGG